jgi:hypothetical protein
MDGTNINVHGLWIGGTLPPMQLLCLKSFAKCGHNFLLWAYEDLSDSIPAGVELKDASLILPRQEVFAYLSGSHKGSFAGFSDIFRAKLLHEYGGWYVDMDILCLKPLDLAEPYVFRSHHRYDVVGNVMKVPKGCPAMLRVFERTRARVGPKNDHWQLPIRILSQEIEAAGLLGARRIDFSNADSKAVVERFILRQEPFLSRWYVFHWCNEYWRLSGWDAGACMPGTRYEKCLEEFDIIHRKLDGNSTIPIAIFPSSVPSGSTGEI